MGKCGGCILLLSIHKFIAVPKTSQVWCAKCSSLVDDGPASDEPMEEKDPWSLRPISNKGVSF